MVFTKVEIEARLGELKLDFLDDSISQEDLVAVVYFFPKVFEEWDQQLTAYNQAVYQEELTERFDEGGFQNLDGADIDFLREFFPKELQRMNAQY